MSHPAPPSHPRLRRTNLVVWAFIAAGVAAQVLLLHRLDPVATPLVPSLIGRLVFLPFWAAATPLILRSAARWPVRADGAGAHLARHAMHASVFIAGTNLLIRVPFFVGANGADVVGLLRGTMFGIAYYGPWALLVYALILGFGDRLARRASVVLPSSDPVAPIASNPPSTAPDALSLRAGDSMRIIPFREIEWIEADDNYVRVASRGQVHRARERLADIEALLDARFVRIHRSAIVPITAVHTVERVSHGDWLVHLTSGRRIRVARSRRAVLESALARAARPGQGRSAGRYSAST